VLFDEPTSALDTELGDRVVKLIRDETKSRGIAAIIVTHNESDHPTSTSTKPAPYEKHTIRVVNRAMSGSSRWHAARAVRIRSR